MLLAAFFVAMSNLCMRRSVDAGGSSKGFLVIQLSIVCLVAILLNPVRTGDYSWSNCMAGFGLSGGIILGAMMAALGKSIEKGPAGLSFAMLSAATVMPAILMSIFFGARFGYFYHWWMGLGSIVVVSGLFWAGWESTRTKQMKKWLFFSVTAFILHSLFLAFMQWRVLFMNFPGENGLFLSFDVDDAKSQWFMPMVFLAASIIQIVNYATSKARLPKKKEFFYGSLGGVANGVGTFFMILATEVASQWELAAIFPFFSIMLIVFCNLWGQWLYKEKVNWKANALCLLGILIATIDWPSLYHS